MSGASPYKTEMIALDDASIAKAAALLRAGQLVAIPSETVYGLAADAFQADAVAQIFHVKRRPSFDPLIVHVSTELSSLERLAMANIVDLSTMSAPQKATNESLMAKFWPGPLTLVMPKSKRIPDIVTSGLSHVAVRMPSHIGLQRLLAITGLPLAAPSANLFGHVSPTLPQHVFSDFAGQIPLILDGGSCAFGIESTIVEVGSDGHIAVLRRGSIPLDSLADATCDKQNNITSPQAPGMLDKHYAPKVPLIVFDDNRDSEAWVDAQKKYLSSAQSIGIIFPSNDPSSLTSILGDLCPIREERRLTRTNDSFEAARYLFSTMRDFEDTKDLIIAVIPRSKCDGLWPAIQDRLQKAANHWIVA